LLHDAALAEAAALALLFVPEATLLLEPSLAQPARPALAASMAIAAIAATVICLIPALLVRACKIKRIIMPNGRARAPAPRRAQAIMARFLYLVRHGRADPQEEPAAAGQIIECQNTPYGGSYGTQSCVP
jgi:hypothetical protein